jgi:hypothetical protein
MGFVSGKDHASVVIRAFIDIRAFGKCSVPNTDRIAPERKPKGFRPLAGILTKISGLTGYDNGT